ncbi:FtsB family cell division protein [Mycobacterium celatum]|uniref:Septation inhibitor protein n=2 Tax=Mycobacterium celatum TaxID=28045 RepID=A0A1X1RPT1_MYCCE|nr:septum formation initiator family protein [Mycobacterium celatum]ORV11033.1 septation inhibitor protein [Mycobacterium celatum]PIB77942.1 septation inhibitor protein [Mycobacterium celatum]
MPEAKRPDPKRRAPAPRPGKAGDSGQGRPRKSPAGRRGANGSRAAPEPVEPVKRGIVAGARERAEQRSEQRLGLTARRAAILAAVVCVLTLTIAGPVRTYFAQRTEMKQLAASEAALRRQIADLEQQKAKLADPAYIAAQARERLGFVMPGEVPYQVQLPPSAAAPTQPGAEVPAAASGDPWYTALWHTIADTPHGPPSQAPAAPPSPPPPGG